MNESAFFMQRTLTFCVPEAGSLDGVFLQLTFLCSFSVHSLFLPMISARIWTDMCDIQCVRCISTVLTSTSCKMNQGS